MTEIEKCTIAKEKGFTYSPITGEIIGIKGCVIRKKNRFGYIVCSFRINRKRYSMYSHRLGWFLHYGELPKKQIDHIDGDKTNNKISNLRDVSNQENSFNVVGVKGYSWDRVNKKFQARIKVNYKIKHLGRYSTEDEAREAYLKAKEKYHIINNQ